MNQSIFSFERRQSVGVARVIVQEIVHPDQLACISREFREYAASEDLRACVLDLSAVTYLTSAAIGMLVNMNAHLEACGRGFAIVAPSPEVAELLRHPHLDRVIVVCATLDEAIDALR